MVRLGGLSRYKRQRCRPCCFFPLSPHPTRAALSSPQRILLHLASPPAQPSSPAPHNRQPFAASLAMLLKNFLTGLAALSLSATAFASPAPMSRNEPSKTSLTKRALEIPVCVSTALPSRAVSTLSSLLRLTCAGSVRATTTVDG